MKFDERRKDAIFARTNGQCHICRKQLVRIYYAKFGSVGSWEIEHSNAKANGGTDRLNNLYPACISCNRSKGSKSSRSVRQSHGFKSAPYSSSKKNENTLWWGVAGAIAGRALLVQLGPIGIVLGGAFGMIAGASLEPD